MNLYSSKTTVINLLSALFLYDEKIYGRFQIPLFPTIDFKNNIYTTE
jgi:hypothetical protein